MSYTLLPCRTGKDGIVLFAMSVAPIVIPAIKSKTCAVLHRQWEAKFEASNVDELDVQTSRLVDLVDTLPVWQQFSAGRSSTLQTLLSRSSFGQQDSCTPPRISSGLAHTHPRFSSRLITLPEGGHRRARMCSVYDEDEEEIVGGYTRSSSRGRRAERVSNSVRVALEMAE